MKKLNKIRFYKGDKVVAIKDIPAMSFGVGTWRVVSEGSIGEVWMRISEGFYIVHFDSATVYAAIYELGLYLPYYGPAYKRLSNEEIESWFHGVSLGQRK